ncbi:MAG: isoprenylcysteine carboxylmethyltransferase family protein [Devosia sp.]|nr:isoprenylcysteine carboxylmethyltransferase family protein [Devosia sp.]
MLPMTMLLIAIVSSVALELIVPIAFLPEPGPASWSSWIGVLLFAAGYGLAASGRREFIRSGTNVYPHMPALRLVTTGPYRFTRNPMYLGLIVGLAGIVLAFSLEMGIVVLALFALALHYGVVAREERYLTRKFGIPYEEFRQHTRRWV